MSQVITTNNVQEMLRNELYNHLNKVAAYYLAGKKTQEKKIFPLGDVGDQCLVRTFNYSGADLIGTYVTLGTWTSGDEAVSNPQITALVLSSNVVTDGDPIGTVVGTLTPTGGISPYTYQIVANPDGAFALDGNSLELAIAADIADTPYSVDIKVTDANGNSFTDTFSVTVNP